MKHLFTLTIMTCMIFNLHSCKSPTANSKNLIDNKEADTLSEISKLINQNGGEAIIENEVVSEVHIIQTPHQCIPHINKLSSVDDFYLSFHKSELKDADFNILREFPETKSFHILYGTLSKDSFSKLSTKFPNIEELHLDGNIDSDLSTLSPLKKLKEFRSDSDHLITLAEAKRISLSQNIQHIEIERATSIEVFNLLKKLPKIKSLSTTVLHDNGDITIHTLDGSPHDQRP